MNQDTIDKLERNMEAASKRLKNGCPISAEKPYGQAYAELVRAGLRQPLKKKYRRSA